MSRRGKHIVIEGPDFGGKSTQVEALAGKLAIRGIDVETGIREPGGTPIGEEIRNVLLNKELGRTALTDLLLFSAARVETLKRVSEELDKGRWVISDRSEKSSFAYQVYGGGVPQEDFANISKPVVEGSQPDLELILMISEDEQQRRMKKMLENDELQLDYFESKGTDFRRRVRNGYIHASIFDGAFLVDGEGDPDFVSDRLFQFVDGQCLSGTPTRDILKAYSNEAHEKYPLEEI